MSSSWYCDWCRNFHDDWPLTRRHRHWMVWFVVACWVCGITALAVVTPWLVLAARLIGTPLVVALERYYVWVLS